MYKSNDSTLKLVAIKTKSKILISDNINGENYFHTRLDNYFYDGEKPTKTYHKDWFEFKQMPTKIEKQLPAKRINERYELKEGFSETELTPKVINKSYIDEDSDFYEVKGLYDFKYETQEAGFEEIPFEITIAEEIDGEFEIVKMEHEPKYSLLDRITTHPVLLQTKPCYLTKEESYRIIRNHVKSNINSKYARVTSDYDFYFTVEKVIELYEPHSYEVNVNAAYSRRKPKYEKRYQRNRTQKIYEVAPKPYNSYPVVEPFTGKDYTDLKNNIDTFLHNLMEMINEPVVECKHCKGRGVVLNEN
ncbi:hypothetical protein [Heyndrickxia camelliae]|uniref:Uncharacterized protein n=1 Tax=Heyndrickxia camelliae TaxID=1707093 RepID=A0A2N3LG27_9BACI|nr:hypothetical protein [Heyndrickxia camelliae]PKR83507.1 hypothetical protein CWO92_18230 [Heyndrickxia camelliae]